ncbi:MAG: AraC family transcriptional regulator, partial [Ekhidna sp.]|nr:AraC family transcriptional regulator [Ekhidna sp.]
MVSSYAGSAMQKDALDGIPAGKEEEILLIEKKLREEKVYRQPKLTLHELSDITGINSRPLSNIINQHYKQSFSDFINQYRVEEVKERLRAKEDEKFTLLAIAIEAGFNSKSSFNHMFKKF